MRYSRNFSLSDLFSSDELKGVLPQIKYKELEGGKHRTKLDTMTTQVFNTSKATARPFYSKLVALRSGNTVTIDGELKGTQDEVVNAIYNALQGQRQTLSFTANNMEIIRSALVEEMNNKRKYSQDSKLALRVQSKEQIKGMNSLQKFNLMQNVLENILYGDDYPKTQNKFRVLQDTEKANKWRQRIGE